MYVYIACEQKHVVSALAGKARPLKFGRSRNPINRVPGLRGAAPTKYELLHELACSDSVYAEKLVLAFLAKEGYLPMTHTAETFNIPLTIAIQICELVTRSVNLYPPAPPMTPMITSAQHRAGCLSHKLTGWQAVLSSPIVYKNQDTTLGALMFRSLFDYPAQAKLSKLGVECVNFNFTRPMFRFGPQWAEKNNLPDTTGFRLNLVKAP